MTKDVGYFVVYRDTDYSQKWTLDGEYDTWDEALRWEAYWEGKGYQVAVLEAV